MENNEPKKSWNPMLDKPEYQRLVSVHEFHIRQFVLENPDLAPISEYGISPEFMLHHDTEHTKSRTAVQSREIQYIFRSLYEALMPKSVRCGLTGQPIGLRFNMRYRVAANSSGTR